MGVSQSVIMTGNNPNKQEKIPQGSGWESRSGLGTRIVGDPGTIGLQIREPKEGS